LDVRGILQGFDRCAVFGDYTSLPADPMDLTAVPHPRFSVQVHVPSAGGDALRRSHIWFKGPVLGPFTHTRINAIPSHDYLLPIDNLLETLSSSSCTSSIRIRIVGGDKLKTSLMISYSCKWSSMQREELEEMTKTTSLTHSYISEGKICRPPSNWRGGPLLSHGGCLTSVMSFVHVPFFSLF
jgi:hypothetical protein